jgi:uncharacterized protein YdeI (YjbR/CyaY-like superfamily)
MHPKFFKSSSDFRNWLQARHKKDRELWVGFYKKDSGKPSLTYSEAVDESLCYGWIDGVRKSIDADAYKIRFTPRKQRSKWSAVNIRRVRQLVDSGRMCPAGWKAFQGAEDHSRAYSYEQRDTAKLPATDERKFRANTKAWAFFKIQPPWYRRTSTFWVISAKREETQQKRLAILIADSARKKTIAPLTRKPAVPKR